jgi:hypothetical protein
LVRKCFLRHRGRRDQDFFLMPARSFGSFRDPYPQAAGQYVHRSIRFHPPLQRMVEGPIRCFPYFDGQNKSQRPDPLDSAPSGENEKHAEMDDPGNPFRVEDRLQQLILNHQRSRSIAGKKTRTSNDISEWNGISSEQERHSLLFALCPLLFALCPLRMTDCS